LWARYCYVADATDGGTGDQAAAPNFLAGVLRHIAQQSVGETGLQGRHEFDINILFPDDKTGEANPALRPQAAGGTEPLKGWLI